MELALLIAQLVLLAAQLIVGATVAPAAPAPTMPYNELLDIPAQTQVCTDEEDA